MKQYKNKNRIIFTLLLMLAFVGVFFDFAKAQVVPQINVSAFLSNGKNDVLQDGEYTVRFALYSKDRTTSDVYPSDSDAGARVWQETQKVFLKDGLLDAYLGAVTALPASIDFSKTQYYLGIRINNDSEFFPRKKLGAAPLAINALSLNGATTGTGSGNIPQLDANGKVDLKMLPTGTGTNQLVLGNDARFKNIKDIHLQNSDTGSTSLVFNIGSENGIGGSNFDLAAGNSGNKPALRFNGTLNQWQYSNDGNIFTSMGAGAVSIADITNLQNQISGLSNADAVKKLLQGCTDGQILKWDGINGNWYCGDDSGGAGSTGVINVKQSGGSTYSGVTTMAFDSSYFSVSKTGSDANITFGNQAANTILAGPLLGVDAVPTFRTLVDADIPSSIARASALSTLHSAVTLDPAGQGYLSLSASQQITANKIALASQVSGTLGVTSGGTGQSTYAAGDMIYASAANTLSKLTGGVVNTGKLLTIDATGLPIWQTVGGAGGMTSFNLAGSTGSPQTIGNGGTISILGGTNISSTASATGTVTLGITGAIPIANGGTNLTTYAAGDMIYASAANTLSKLTGGVANTGKLLTIDATGLPIWQTVGGAGGMTSFNLAGSTGSPQTIGNGGTISILGGTNISSTASATGTVTLGLTGMGTLAYKDILTTGIAKNASAYSFSGLDAVGAGNSKLSLLQGCNDTQILKFSDNVDGLGSRGWMCADNSSGQVAIIKTGGWDSAIPSVFNHNAGVTEMSFNKNFSVDKITDSGGDYANIGMKLSDVARVDGSGATSSFSGFELNGADKRLSLLQGCQANEILKWDGTNKKWQCSTDAGAATSVININEGVTPYTGKDTLVFNSNDFTITEAGTNANIAIDYINSKITRADQAENISGAWNFQNAVSVALGKVAATNTPGSLKFISAGNNNSFGTTFTAGNQAANIAYTLPTVAGTANGQVLKTDTSGNLYWEAATGGSGAAGTVTSVSTGNGLTGGTINTTGTLSINLLSANGGTTPLANSASGLQFSGTSNNQLALLQGCSDGQVLIWDDAPAHKYWKCSAVSGGAGGLGGSATPSQVAYWSGTNTLSGENNLAVSRGGTGVGTITGIVKGNGTSAFTSAAYSDLITLLGFTPYNSSNPSNYITLGSLSATGPVAYNSGVISMSQASGAANGYLSSGDWTTFNNKQAALGFTPYNGATNPNGYISLGSLSATGPVAYNSGVISMSQASGSTNGYLSSGDWTTFNNKQAALGFTPYNSSNPSNYITLGSLSATGPVAYNSGVISMSQASGAASGYLSSGDWITFNGKQAAGAYLLGNQTITLSGDLTGSGTTSISASIAAEKINESMLATGAAAPANGSILTFNSTGGGFTWVGAVAGAAHGILSSSHSDADTTAGALVVGDLMVVKNVSGNKWSKMATGTATGQYLTTDSSVNGYAPKWSTNTFTLAGNLQFAGAFTTAGAYPIKLTATGNTDITLPTSGTLMGNPMANVGDIIYGSTAGAATTLLGNITTTKKFLMSVGNGTVSQAPVWSTFGVADGGTGVDGSAAGNGKLLIGNGTGYTLANLTAGAGISINNTAGAITISSSGGVSSITGTASQIAVSGGGVGAVTLSLPQNIATNSTPTFGALTLSGLTAGSIPFIGTGGAISQNNTNFFWDNTNMRMGIGTGAPSDGIEIFGAGKGLRLSYNNSVGVNLTSTSTGELNLSTSSASGDSAFIIGDSTNHDVAYLLDGFGVNDYYMGIDSSDGNSFKIGAGLVVGGTPSVTMLTDGKFGIGTQAPTSLLSVGALSQFQVNSSGQVISGAWGGSVIGSGYGGTGRNDATVAVNKMLIGNGTGYDLSTLTQGAGMTITNSGGLLTIANAGVTNISGASGHISVSASTGSVVLSLPQSIATTATPTFGGLIVSGMTTGSIPFFTAGGTLGQNNANLFWNNSANALGIGTVNPISGGGLEIFGPGKGLRLAYDGSNGVTMNPNPTGGLNISAQSSASDSAVLIGNGAQQDTMLFFDGYSTDYYVGVDYSDSDKLKIGTGSVVGTNSFLTMSSAGTVGIGSASQFQINSGGTVTAGTWNGGIIGAAYGGTGISTAGLSGIPMLSSGTWSVAASLGVTAGGTGTTTAFTTGSMVFAGASGVYSQDNANLFWDNTNKRLGIGTASPAASLSILGAANSLRLSYDAANYVAFSSTSTGDLQFTSSSVTDANITIGDNTATSPAIIFDNLSQDYYAGVDNADSVYKIGAGQTMGSAAILSVKASNGFVGIGAVAPTAMLQVGTSTTGGNVRIDNGWLCVDNNGSCTGAATAGTVYAVAAYTTGADYAEYFFTNDTDLVAGEAVCVDGSVENGVKRCQNNGDNNIMGIVSSNPSIVGNKNHANDPHYKIIGMLGQVAGNVSNENGDIKVGDSLTAALGAGKMRKANAGESTVGVALENSANKNGKIQILISRRNQSLTVEKVEQAVTDNIAAMNIKDQVSALVANAATSLDAQLKSQQTIFDSLQAQITESVAIAAKLRTDLNLINDQNKTLVDFVAALNVNSLIYKDALGNLDLAGGKFAASEVETGVLKIKIIDATKPTIGQAVISKVSIDTNSDGIDDFTGLDGKYVQIKTGAVTQDAKIFTSFVKNPGSASWVEKTTDAVTGQFDGFKIMVDQAVKDDAGVDWWLVESKK